MPHAFQLRRDGKREVWQRQLPALAAAIFGAALLASAAAEDAAREELRAAQLMETALWARPSGAEEWARLERVYAELEARFPRDAAVKNARGEFLWSRGEHARAMQAWLAAEQLAPEDAVVLDHLGGGFLSAGDARKAAGYYARAVRSAPENAAYHHNYANVAFLFRHELLDAAHPDADALLRTALAHFGEAARLAPLDLEYARAYAETFYTVPQPDWRAALRAWQHFHDISPRKDFALLNLARVQISLGELPAAQASLNGIQSPEFQRPKARLEEKIRNLSLLPAPTSPD